MHLPSPSSVQSLLSAVVQAGKWVLRIRAGGVREFVIVKKREENY